MKAIIWEDGEGYLHRSFIKDEDDKRHAKYGVPADPPELDPQAWEELRKVIHNTLVKEGLYTYSDIQKHSVGLALIGNLVKRHFAALYREAELNSKQ
jgi:hypothetical protein